MLRCFRNACARHATQHRERQRVLNIISRTTLRHLHTATTSASVTSEEAPDRYCLGGYHPVRLGEKFNDKYAIVSKLGFGAYSTVWLAKDLTSTSPRHVALKILTADSYGGSNAIFELDILKHINRPELRNPGAKHAVHLLDDFLHEGPNGSHLCLVLELAGKSVYKLQQSQPRKQLPREAGQRMSRQVLQALDWLHNTCGVIHTDVKPDNILIDIPNIEAAVQRHLATIKDHDTGQPEQSGLLSRPIEYDLADGIQDLDIKIADFGVASWTNCHLTEWIQAPSLRAPEVILGAPWGISVDIWSFACVIYELMQGRVLFRGRPGPKDAWTAEEDQLAQMMELFGPIPTSVREAGSRTDKYLDDDGNLLHIEQLYPCELRSLLAQSANQSMSATENGKFEAFLLAMLQYEPSARKTARNLLGEAWLQSDV